MYKLHKAFSFCYSHTVYTQNVVEKYAGNSECPCQRLHGHQGTVEVHMSAESLDSRGFVIDFKELAFMKNLLDGHVDHRHILSVNDPNFEIITGGWELDTLPLQKIELLDGVMMGYRIDIDSMDIPKGMRRHLSSFVIVEFNPTSEELARWIYEGVEKVIEKSPFECSVDKVTWSETPKTQATYSK